MKLYLHTNGCFYEKQADCPSKSFEAVEFPFAASPKADFVAWMNNNVGIGAKAGIMSATPAPAEDGLITADGLFDPKGELRRDPLPVDQHVAKVAAQAPAAPKEYFGAHHPLTTMSVEDWIEVATPSQLGTVVHTAANRLHALANKLGDPA